MAEELVFCELCLGYGRRYVSWFKLTGWVTCCDCNGTGKRTLTGAEKRLAEERGA